MRDQNHRNQQNHNTRGMQVDSSAGNKFDDSMTGIDSCREKGHGFAHFMDFMMPARGQRFWVQPKRRTAAGPCAIENNKWMFGKKATCRLTQCATNFFDGRKGDVHLFCRHPPVAEKAPACLFGCSNPMAGVWWSNRGGWPALRLHPFYRNREMNRSGNTSGSACVVCVPTAMRPGFYS